ncbi:MAG: GDP-mannose dehydrogenase, partial [Candidatus Marinimicrobia bacterium]|nr:GDP-mannose dehydrogenase [Candidatus Neomarinimicrobiota bacterium]
VERLLGKGYNVKVYDKNVNLSRIMGKNKDFLYNKLPHIQEILINKIETLKNHSDIIVITSKNSDIKDLLDFNGEIIDLVRVSKIENNLSNYFGICW